LSPTGLKAGSTKKGCFVKPNLVPIDKFRPENVEKYIAFREKVESLKDRTRFHFCDEKHIVNKDAYPKKVRADPLTGRADCVGASGNFRDTYNLLCIISANPTKEHPIEYTLGLENGNSTMFIAFMEFLIGQRWFERGDVLILDNAGIHTGSEATILEDLLWEAEIDGAPLNVLVLFLPTRSPELNPIELIFHILARRLHSFRFSNIVPDGTSVMKKAAAILDDIPTEMVLRCVSHCGYFD
jgi:transposase